MLPDDVLAVHAANITSYAMRTILIIGGGFCGVACAVQVLRQAGARPVRVLLLERLVLGGVAYARCGPEHLLNVPAGKMSAVDDDPESFLRFARIRLPHAAASDFLPRRLYGDYLSAMLDAASRAAAAAPALAFERSVWPGRGGAARARLERIAGQAVSLSADGAGLRAVLADGRTLDADRVVLATGHFPPCDLPALASLHADSRYQHDPWDLARLAAVHPAEPVLLLGSGLTAVDVALTLLARGVRRITMLSRHGLLPQPHRGLRALHHPHPALATGTAGLWGDAATLRVQLRAFRRALAASTLPVTLSRASSRARGTASMPSIVSAAATGSGSVSGDGAYGGDGAHGGDGTHGGDGARGGDGADWRDVMAALRPHTANIWRAWPEKERRRFLRHVQPYWDSHRHRLAPAAHEPLQRALQDGRVSVIAARVLACTGGAERLKVTLQRRGAGEEELWAARIINCTGSCPSPERCGDALIAQLVADGVLQGAQAGAEVSAAWRGRLAYIGPWLKASHWEATAVPELRKFAEQAAAWALT
ncbi:MAG TPA: FAD/NAD(P)-binding protein [Pseudoduganella sp.]